VDRRRSLRLCLVDHEGGHGLKSGCIPIMILGADRPIEGISDKKGRGLCVAAVFLLVLLVDEESKCVLFLA